MCRAAIAALLFSSHAAKCRPDAEIREIRKIIFLRGLGIPWQRAQRSGK
jgi:hypothetical protein